MLFLDIFTMQACIAAGTHPNLVNVLGKLSQPIDCKAGLVFSFISADYTNLGGPPSLDSCTRDTYSPDAIFTLPVILQITRGIASAVAQLHTQGIMHGDLYAHNILVNTQGDSILGDFGAASFYNPADRMTGPALERLESRAFGCLLEDLLDRCGSSAKKNEATAQLRDLQQRCMAPIPSERPLFGAICQRLAAVAALV